jgi:membrane-bound lytic murein transglycosylase C
MLLGSYLRHLQNDFSPPFLSDYVVENQSVNVFGIRSIVSEAGESVISSEIEKTHISVESDKKPTVNLQIEEPYDHLSQKQFFEHNGKFTETSKLPVMEHVEGRYPALIKFDDEIVLEFPEKLATKLNMKRAISRVLLSKSIPAEHELLTSTAINLKSKPFLYKKVRNQFGRAIRFPVDAYLYAEYLQEHHKEIIPDGDRNYIVIRIPISKFKTPKSIKPYQKWVFEYAKQFKVSPDLIFAIMEVESAFNPNAVSHANAVGLMQIKASAAGKDVYHQVYGKTGMPPRKELFNPQKNIRMGVAYVGLLKNHYFGSINNEQKKELLAISSYNGGIKSVLTLFGKTPDKALEVINSLSAEKVHNRLRVSHAYSETRRYIDKVLKKRDKYRDILDIPV